MNRQQRDKNNQSIIKAHKETIKSSIQLVKANMWEASEVLEMVIPSAEEFYMRFIGGTKETCDMVDDLFRDIIEAKEFLLNS